MNCVLIFRGTFSRLILFFLAEKCNIVMTLVIDNIFTCSWFQRGYICKYNLHNILLDSTDNSSEAENEKYFPPQKYFIFKIISPECKTSGGSALDCGDSCQHRIF